MPLFSFFSFLEVRAVVQKPEVRLISSHLTVEECFVNIPVSKTVTLQNLTLFDINYHWNKVQEPLLLSLMLLLQFILYLLFL